MEKRNKQYNFFFIFNFRPIFWGVTIETRPGKYGKNLGILLNFVINNMPSGYKKAFLEELCNYSLEGRKKGTSPNSGCIYELQDIEKINVENPKELAKLIKEGLHLMYQKQTAAKILAELQKELTID